MEDKGSGGNEDGRREDEGKEDEMKETERTKNKKNRKMQLFSYIYIMKRVVYR